MAVAGEEDENLPASYVEELVDGRLPAPMVVPTLPGVPEIEALETRDDEGLDTPHALAA